MNSIGRKKREFLCNNTSFIIELYMIILTFISCIFALFIGIIHNIIITILIYIIAFLSLTMMVYKFLEICINKIELYQKGFILNKPFRKIIIHKKNISSITWHESINLTDPRAICFKCNIKLKNNKKITISSNIYKDLYDIINIFKD